MMVVLGVSSLFLLLLMGVPLFAVLALAAMTGFYLSGVDLSAVAIEIYRIADTPLLLSLPFFTFTGYLLSEGRSAQRLLRLIRACTGGLPHGAGLMALVTCAIFTAFTGASGVTLVALGAVLLPALRYAGYGKRFSLGLLTASGSLGLLFPPSLPLIVYGIIAQQTEAGKSLVLEDMLVAGIVPGLLMMAMLALWLLWTHRRTTIAVSNFSWKELASAARESAWELPLPVFVLGGIFGGFFAVSEVAAVTALYVLGIQMFVHREIAWRRFVAITQESMIMVGGIILILGVAMAFSSYLIDAEVPAKLFEWVTSHIDNKYVFLLLLNVFLLIVGALLDIYSALAIVAPLVLPIAVGYGVHPAHLGVIFLANLQLGYMTPPVGMSLFIASYRFKQSILVLFRAAFPFLMVLLLAVLAITYLPMLSLIGVRGG